MKFINKMLYTGFFSGYCPVAPGTAGTLVAVLLYIAQYFIAGPEMVVWTNVVIIAVTALPAIWLGTRAERDLGEKDPACVVLDEMIGLWIALAFHPFSWYRVAAAFVLFRLFDITKPWPINSIQNLKGGWGIMLDDYLAGVYANICILLIWIALGYLNLSVVF